MLDEILKKINSEVLTESVVSDLKTAFESAVNEAVEVKNKEYMNTTLISETEKILDKYDAKFEEFTSSLSEQKEKEVEAIKTELVESLDSYLDIVVEEFLKENKVSIDQEVEAERVNAIVEAFDTLLVTAGVDISRIVESKTQVEDKINESAERKVVEMEHRLDKLIAEKKDLEKQNREMLVIGLKSEVCEGMSVVQKDKFEKLASIVDMGEDKVEYLNRLEAIKESIVSDSSKTDKKVVQESDVKPTEVIVESKKDEKLSIDSSRFF